MGSPPARRRDPVLSVTVMTALPEMAAMIRALLEAAMTASVEMPIVPSMGSMESPPAMGSQTQMT